MLYNRKHVCNENYCHFVLHQFFTANIAYFHLLRVFNSCNCKLSLSSSHLNQHFDILQSSWAGSSEKFCSTVLKSSKAVPWKVIFTFHFGLLSNTIVPSTTWATLSYQDVITAHLNSFEAPSQMSTAYKWQLVTHGPESISFANNLVKLKIIFWLLVRYA